MFELYQKVGETMTAKQFLGQYQHCEQMIRQKEEKAAELRHKASSIEVNIQRQEGTQKIGDGLGRAVQAYVEMEEEYTSEVERLKGIQTTILQVIEQVKNQKEKELLSWMYINHERLVDIEKKELMHYEYRQLCRIHGHALLSVRDVLQCHTKPVV